MLVVHTFRNPMSAADQRSVGGLSPYALGLCLGLGISAASCGGAANREPSDETGATPITWRAPDVLPCRQVPAEFGVRAMEHATKLVGFGPRTPGSEASRKSIDYCAKELRRLGFEVTVDVWQEEAEGGVTLRNLSAVCPGSVPDRILLACHHDTKITSGHDNPAHNFPFAGANDGASGQAVLLALAEQLHRAPKTKATIELVMFDGEESFPFAWDPTRALYGSRRYANRYREAMLRPGQPAPIRALLLLDMVGGKAMNIDDETSSTPGLRRLMKIAVASCGHRDAFFQETGPVLDDHRPFLALGIPAIDLIDLYGNRTWHTPEDTLENLSGESMRTVGEVVWTMLPAVEQGYLPQPTDGLSLPR